MTMFPALPLSVAAEAASVADEAAERVVAEVEDSESLSVASASVADAVEEPEVCEELPEEVDEPEREELELEP